jgi:hypothetical protein
MSDHVDRVLATADPATDLTDYRAWLKLAVAP